MDMKKWCVFLLCFVLTFVCCSCQMEDEQNFGSKLSYGDHPELLDYIKGAERLTDNKIIRIEINDEGWAYFIYNLGTKENIKVGTITNFVISDNSSAEQGDNFYFFANVGSEANQISTLYEIDIEKQKMRAATFEKLYQTLVPVKATETGILLLKGTVDAQNEGTSYIESFDESGKKTILIEKK